MAMAARLLNLLATMLTVDQFAKRILPSRLSVSDDHWSLLLLKLGTIGNVQVLYADFVRRLFSCARQPKRLAKGGEISA